MLYLENTTETQEIWIPRNSTIIEEKQQEDEK